MADDIPQTVPPLAVGWRQDQASDHRDPREGRGRGEYARAVNAYERVSPPPHALEDALSVQGVPQADLTPAVRRALGRLMGEVDRLRHDLDVAREGDGAGTMAGVRERAESLPLLGARSLEWAFRHRMTEEEDRGWRPAVLYFYAGHYEQLRLRDGLAAAEAVYHAMAEALARARVGEEVAGALGGASVVMLVPFDGRIDVLWTRARTLARDAGNPVPWRTETLRVGLLLGVHVPRRGEGPGESFWQAEQAARLIV